MLDIAIRGGTVLDGRGSVPLVADIGISGEKIKYVGQLPEVAAAEIDASGLIISPGFIDIHSHSDYTLIADPRAVSAIHQGVTLEVVGNCGHGCFPVVDRELATKAIYGYTDSVPLTWTSAHGFFQRADEASPAVNMLSLVPHGQLRLSTIGLTDRQPTDRELKDMEGLLLDALDQGAWGLSTGLEYATEAGASEFDVTRLCRVLGGTDHLYACHTRYRDAGAPQGVEEAIRTAVSAGVRLQISHLVPRSGDDDMEECITLVEDARDSGLDVAFDMHTRLFGFTYLYSVLPPWVFTEGETRLKEYLRDPEARSRMAQFRSILSASGDWERVVLLDTDLFSSYQRRSLQSIADERSQAPLDCAFDLLLESAEDMGSLMVLIDCHSEAQQKTAFSHPLSMPASDATTMAPDGPLADMTFHGAYTWASYFYRFATNKTHILSPTEAVRRLTSVPAERLGLSDRGSIEPGKYADLSIFDHLAFKEAGSRFEPNQLAEGMVHVYVNGIPVLQDGHLTGKRPGKVIRKQ